MKLLLSIIHRDMVIETLELEPGSYKLGRSQENNIVVQHFSLQRHHGEVFFEEGQWFYRDIESDRTRLINNAESISLSGDVSLATADYVEHKRTDISDFSSVFRKHQSKLKYRVSIVSGLIAALLLISVVSYQFVKSKTPVNTNNLLNNVRTKIVEFEVKKDERSIKDLKDYASLQDSDFKETSGFCTGFLVAPNVVLTASHCLFGSMVVDINNDFYLRTSDGEKHKVTEVLGFDIKRDYLYLKAEGMESYGHLDFAPEYKIEQKVYTVGNVHGEGIAIRDGIISSETTDLNDPDVKFIRYSAGTSPGNSGGPLVDEQGRVVALVFAATWTENFNLGTSAEDLRKGFEKFVTPESTEQPVSIELKKLLNFNAQTMLQALSLPYLSQFDDYPEIVQEFNNISIDIKVPTSFDTIDELILTSLNNELISTYGSVQKLLNEKEEIVLDWKSFVTKKTPSILPSQFDFSQNIFVKKNGRYYPKVAGFIDSPSKADMTKYTNQLEKERKFDFQAYGYNIHLEEKSVGLSEGDVFYKPRNTTGAKLRLQDLSKGVPYSQLIVRKNSKEKFSLEKFLENFAEPDGVLVGAASRFIRPKAMKDFTMKDFKLGDRTEVSEVKDTQGRIWQRSKAKLFSSTHIYGYCTNLPEGQICLGRIFYIYNDHLLGIIEENFRKFVLSHLLINPYFWQKDSLVSFIESGQANNHNLMKGTSLSVVDGKLTGSFKSFPFKFKVPQAENIQSIRVQTGLLGTQEGTDWTGYGLDWVKLNPKGKDLLCGLGLEVFESQSNFILNYLRDRKKQEKLKKIKGEDPKPLPGLWYRPFRGLSTPFQVYGYCAPIEEDPRIEDQYFVDFKNSKPFKYEYSVN